MRIMIKGTMKPAEDMYSKNSLPPELELSTTSLITDRKVALVLLPKREGGESREEK